MYYLKFNKFREKYLNTFYCLHLYKFLFFNDNGINCFDVINKIGSKINYKCNYFEDLKFLNSNKINLIYF